MNVQQYLAYFYGAHARVDVDELVTYETVLPVQEVKRLATEFACTEGDAIQVAMNAMSYIAYKSPGLLLNLAMLYHSDALNKEEEQAMVGTIVAALVKEGALYL